MGQPGLLVPEGMSCKVLKGSPPQGHVAYVPLGPYLLPA